MKTMIETFLTSPLASYGQMQAWDLTSHAQQIVEELFKTLPSDYHISNGKAVHPSAHVVAGAILKAPLIIGPKCFIAHGAYIRGGCWLDAECILGPGAELKSSFLFAGTKLAHFNFVGDSVLGSGCNLEAGSIIANYRNECEDLSICFLHEGRRVETGVAKFGALLGDRVKLGANAVIAPGAILSQDTHVPRLGLIDQRAM